MSDSYLQHQLSLLAHVRTVLQAVAEQEIELMPEGNSELFIERFDEMVAELQQSQADLYLGQEIICQIFQRYPQIAHLVPRDLLWFFGGDCLHYMPDAEIELFQQLEDRRFAALEQGESFDWATEVELLFMPVLTAKQ
ncbi:dehydrogenase [Thiopseudomonas alkaliphila]|uniref:Dehydrogenase n=1 Tax=Thiopseudomonas alkaliphila TaxID=1697053 RepID=A0A0K1XCQ0_9GAMM|nr:PA2817 family protein [Thiopseudomonas alkaliphila]AKX44544.1 dehydrogenase [Thiopseudomonas alkaliphila]AKX46730.1 dehydrogenase [Thiopseudomonas alkaliphila]AKX49834.1 dehydrogenase [Thiopseudomonas alkaliphila]AKX52279.1 dehydrogenase [Thiopseudomonas alkaliphila]AKX59034.1 dehydrogenase [Thiopseudomonas alkaliphila]